MDLPTTEEIRMGKLQVVVGGGFGSEGKGAVAAHLAARETEIGHRVMSIRVAGPNAGHTVWGPIIASEHPDFGHLAEFKLRQVPTAAVSNPTASLAIAAGSEIDLDVLGDEIRLLEEAGYEIERRLYVDRSATLLYPRHIAAELQAGLTAKLGSTSKGIGAARAERIMRNADLYGGSFDIADMARTELALGTTVQIEGTQGYGLGLHTSNYPFVTSSDCRAVDFLSMAGISPWDAVVEQLEVYVVFRTRPIRVAGNSGPMLGETTWSDIGLPEERTTVTNKVRRVGEWDAKLARAAVDANGGASVVGVLTMLDHVFPQVAGWVTADWNDQTERGHVAHRDGTIDDVRKYIRDREDEVGCQINLLGTSPTTVIDRREAYFGRG